MTQFLGNEAMGVGLLSQKCPFYVRQRIGIDYIPWRLVLSTSFRVGSGRIHG